LIDGNTIQRILRLAGVVSGDTVVEIGPGPGALTQALLAAGATVIAVEKDTRFAEALHRLQGPLTVVSEDFLTWDFATLLRGKRCKVVANLPYHITTPILSRLLPHEELFTSLTIMVQKEVADRMTAPAGSEAYSSLSLFIAFYADARRGFIVKPTCFMPRPKVESAVVQLLLHTPPLADPAPFFALIHQAFQHRRKMMRASLRELIAPEVTEQALTELGHSPRARPEELSLAEFLRFFAIVEKQKGDVERKRRDDE
jgi:16S rRNA (adenine1518-N6/adenine1519-N6)-dimethyltransferase